MLEGKLITLIEKGLIELAFEFAEGKKADEIKDVFRSNEWSMEGLTTKSELAALLVLILTGDHEPKKARTRKTKVKKASIIDCFDDVEENSQMTPEDFLLKYKDLINEANIGDKGASRKLKKLLHPDSTPYKHLENHIVFKTLFKTLLDGEKYDRYFEKNKEEIHEKIKQHSESFKY